jgi:hypothetical protein
MDKVSSKGVAGWKLWVWGLGLGDWTLAERAAGGEEAIAERSPVREGICSTLRSELRLTTPESRSELALSSTT